MKEKTVWIKVMVDDASIVYQNEEFAIVKVSSFENNGTVLISKKFLREVKEGKHRFGIPETWKLQVINRVQNPNTKRYETTDKEEISPRQLLDLLS